MCKHLSVWESGCRWLSVQQVMFFYIQSNKSYLTHWTEHNAKNLVSSCRHHQQLRWRVPALPDAPKRADLWEGLALLVVEQDPLILQTTVFLFLFSMVLCATCCLEGNREQNTESLHDSVQKVTQPSTLLRESPFVLKASTWHHHFLSHHRAASWPIL